MADSKLERGAGTGLVKSEVQYCVHSVPRWYARRNGPSHLRTACTLHAALSAPCILHPAQIPPAICSLDVIHTRRDRLDMWLPCLVRDNDALQL
jgi:hypothetical protein